MGRLIEHAKKMRSFIEKCVQSLNDSEALEAVSLYPKWKKLVELGSVESPSGYKFQYDGKLYACINANPTFQADWIPGEGTESIYVRIDETHTGTVDDPIPYDGNMALVSGMYYAQDGVTYVCTRDTVSPVYHALRDLVGLYVETVEAKQ